jgi:glutamine cyclotransferase
LCSPRQHPEENNFNRIHQITADVEEITKLHEIEYESGSVVQQVHKICP